MCLVSVKCLKRLASALSLETELRESMVQYLKAREESLTDRESLRSSRLTKFFCMEGVALCSGKLYRAESDNLRENALGFSLKESSGEQLQELCYQSTRLMLT